MSRSNWLWPLLVIGSALLLLAYSFGILPAAATDLIGRAWPIVLIILGLSTLIGRRFRYANLLVLGVCVVLLVGLIITAYGKQSSKLRSDYHESFSQALPAEVKSIRINVVMLLAQMSIEPTEARTISAEFSGSTESRVSSSYSADQGVGLFTISEARTSSIPMLESIGHGKLTLHLPTGIAIDELTLRGGEGDLSLDSSGTTLRNLNVQIAGGDISLILPALTPQEALGGSVRTGSGSLTVNVPQELTIKLTVESGKANFDPANYLLLSGGVLQTAGTRDFQVVLSAGASGGVTIKP